jgi:hypothetical protein
MDGPGWATYIIPLVVTPVLAVWLIMVYYAAAHPARKTGRPAAGQPEAAGGSPARPVARPAGPGEPLPASGPTAEADPARAA